MALAAKLDDVRAARPLWVGLVVSARQGDRAALGELHRQFSRLVHAIVIARVSADDAKDLVQDVFVTLVQKLSQLEDDQAFPAWLMQLARTRVARHLRERPRTLSLDSGEDERAAPDASGAPDARRVLKVLQALPEAYAETLAMRLIEGMTGPEIAERTGLTPGSVRVNLHRGMKLLREALGLSTESMADE